MLEPAGLVASIAGVAAGTTWRPGAGAASSVFATAITFKLVEFVPYLQIASVQLTFQMHRQPLLCVAGRLQSPTHFAHFHLLVILLLRLIQK